MTDERRYSEDEVREIFEAAARDPGGRAPAPRDGLTLGQLQTIARDVGLPPERVAEAARTLDLRRGSQPRETHLAMPVSVGWIVPLPRTLTDPEWSVLVAELRETFRARGHDRSSASGRLWTNGNLHAVIETGPEGPRLRLGTTKSNARVLNLAGVGSLAVALVLLLVLVLTGQPVDDLDTLLILAGMGGTALGYNALRLPSWAGQRERQFEYIAARARALTGAESPAPLTEREDA